MIVEIINRTSKKTITTLWNVSQINESCDKFYIKVGKEGQDDIKVYEYDDSIEIRLVMF